MPRGERRSKKKDNAGKRRGRMMRGAGLYSPRFKGSYAKERPADQKTVRAIAIEKIST